LKKNYELVKKLSLEFPVQAICKLLKVSRSAYYSYIKGETYQQSLARQTLLKEVKEIFENHKSRYGSRRIQSELQDRGYQIGQYKVRNLMKEQDLVAIQPKSFVPKTTQGHPWLKRSPNLLLEKSNQPTASNQVVVGDITYLPSKEFGYDVWLYLAVWMDLFSRKIVGWRVDEHMQDSLIIIPMHQFIGVEQPEKRIIVHSDGGGQYGSNDFLNLLEVYQFRQSMTRKDNHYDNAFIESLFSRLKAELLNGKTFSSLADAEAKVFEYIEGYYNTIRKHSSIGYLSPNQFED